MNNLLSDLKNQLIQNGIATEHEIRGCTAREVEEFEGRLGIRLPAAFRQFMLLMGRRAGRFFYGTEAFYPEIVELTDIARAALLEDDAQLELPSDAIVISMHQGYQFMFIRAAQGDDPPVYYWIDGAHAFEQKATRVSAYFRRAADDQW